MAQVGLLSGWWFQNPSETYEFVSWDGWKFPTEWKLIKFHGSKPPSSCFFYPLISLELRLLVALFFQAGETWQVVPSPKTYGGRKVNCPRTTENHHV